MAESNGAPIRLDDHGDTPGTATAMSGTSAAGVTTYVETGVIERSTDVDQFSVNAAAGALTVTLQPATRSPNLDAVIELRSAAGTLPASANPVDALSASLSVTLPAAGTPPTAVASASGATSGNNHWRASAAVTVLDSQGRPVVGATVSGRWSGLVGGTAAATTGGTGVASFQSGTTRSRGTITFTVTGVTLAGYQYDATLNTETSDSISR